MGDEGKGKVEGGAAWSEAKKGSPVSISAAWGARCACWLHFLYVPRDVEGEDESELVASASVSAVCPPFA